MQFINNLAEECYSWAVSYVGAVREDPVDMVGQLWSAKLVCYNSKRTNNLKKQIFLVCDLLYTSYLVMLTELRNLAKIQMMLSVL